MEMGHWHKAICRGQHWTRRESVVLYLLYIGNQFVYEDIFYTIRQLTSIVYLYSLPNNHLPYNSNMHAKG